MIGSLDPAKKKVLVVGAGISGLLAAYHAKKKGFEVTVLESSERAGGLIRTQTVLSQEGAQLGIAESAAHSLLMSEGVEKLCKELGVELISVRPESRARFIYRDGKALKFPLKAVELVILLLRGLFMPALPFVRSNKATVEDFVKYFLGSAAVKNLFVPLVRGIYAVHPRELLLNITFPKLKVPLFLPFLVWMLPWQIIKKFFLGVKRAPMVAAKQGMEDLVRKLAAQLGSSVQTNMRVENLEDLLSDSNVVLAVPAAECARLLSKIDTNAASAIGKIRYAGLTSCTVCLPTQDLQSPPKGVGVLMTENSGVRCLGVLFNSSMFDGRANAGTTNLAVMYPPEIKNIEQQLTEDLSKLFGLNRTDRLTLVKNVWSHAIPKYDSVLLSALESLKSGACARPGLVVAGNWTGQVSIRGMIDELS